MYTYERGLRIILKGKNEICNKVRTPVRCLKEPNLNSNATDYIDLLNWKDCKVTVPPILLNMSEEQFQVLVIGYCPPIMNFESFPCHTQSVERCVKLVTEVATAVCGAKNRDDFIPARLRSS
jgi:hypothetical protein